MKLPGLVDYEDVITTVYQHVITHCSSVLAIKHLGYDRWGLWGLVDASIIKSSHGLMTMESDGHNRQAKISGLIIYTVKLSWLYQWQCAEKHMF